MLPGWRSTRGVGSPGTVTEISQLAPTRLSGRLVRISASTAPDSRESSGDHLAFASGCSGRLVDRVGLLGVPTGDEREVVPEDVQRNVRDNLDELAVADPGGPSSSNSSSVMAPRRSTTAAASFSSASVFASAALAQAARFDLDVVEPHPRRERLVRLRAVRALV